VSSALIQQGLAALRTGDAAAARRVFETALAEGESGQVLEGLGEALYLGREYVAAVAHYERAYVAYRRERQSMAAGRAARTVAWITGNVLGDWAVRSGWLARARALLEEAGVDRPEHGWVLIIKAFSEPEARSGSRCSGRRSPLGAASATPTSSSWPWPISEASM
jgi:tetratricopeptide (TPR) repeat protein